jgi:hypothetical protein
VNLSFKVPRMIGHVPWRSLYERSGDPFIHEGRPVLVGGGGGEWGGTGFFTLVVLIVGVLQQVQGIIMFWRQNCGFLVNVYLILNYWRKFIDSCSYHSRLAL